MTRALITLAIVMLPSVAFAIDRKCPRGQTWNISQGTCTKKKPAPKLSPQEKYDRATDELEGVGRKPDPKRGVRLLEESCAARHGPACNLLGFLYVRGRVVTRDDVKAGEYFVNACKLNDLDGCNAIGDLAFRVGAYEGSRIAFERACALSSGVGCARSGDLLERGIGGPADPDAAAPQYARALVLLAPKCPEDGTSCFTLGWLAQHGKGLEKSPAKALEAFRAGCTTGHGEACLSYAAFLDQGVATAKDAGAANEIFEKACMQYDNGEACRRIGERLAIAKKNLDRAFQLAQRGCTLDPKYCGTFGELHRIGLGTTANQAEATRQYKIACEAGGDWCDTFGKRAHDGEGMAKDDAAALAAFERGCKGGYTKSCHEGTKVLIETKSDDARAFVLASMGCDYGHGDSCYLAGWLQAAGRSGGPASQERALVLFERGCTSSPVACSAAGDIHRSGTGAAKDPAKAIALFEKGCEGTEHELSSSACRSWGLMAYLGEVGAKDVKLALSSFMRACKYGEPQTCNWLGYVAHEAGEKLETVLPVADKACKDGYEHACIAHGNLLASSDREADRHKAYEAFTASCGRTVEDACLRQADMLASGWGITKDAAKAEQLYRTRCDAGSAAGCFGLGQMSTSQGKHADALGLYVRSCDGGSPDACSAVGYAYYTAKGTRWDIVQAAKFFIKACDLDSALGCSNAGDVYRWGIGMPLDAKKAFAYYEKACSPKDPIGCAGVGHYVATGEGGIAIDRKRAEEALRSACTSEVLVVPEACRALAELLENERKGTPAEIARLRTTAFARTQELAKDNPYYMYVLGTYHADGMATMRDPTQSLVWMSKACDGFDPLGCIAAGKALRATSKADDGERARVYFERACAAGVDDGCALGKVKPDGPRPVAKAKGCGCNADVTSGGPTAAILVVLALALSIGRRRERGPTRRRRMWR